ncbi:MAG: sulfite exporter TauE/SafE family protein [Pseudomonadota bacterium]
MQFLFDTFGSLIADRTFWAISAVVFVAGVVRGFSGFGTAMIYIPMAGALVNPIFAVASLQIFDLPPTLPLVIQAMRRVIWRDVLPIVLFAALGVPVGITMLKLVDPLVLRWLIAGIIVTLLAALTSGFRYSGRPNIAMTAGAGLCAGLCSGIASMAGPPAILYWISGPAEKHVLRANTQVFLGLMTIFTLSSFFIAGVFTRQSIIWGIALMVPYGAGLFAGAQVFPFASERIYRKVAFGLILLAVALSLPILDEVLR